MNNSGRATNITENVPVRLDSAGKIALARCATRWPKARTGLNVETGSASATKAGRASTVMYARPTTLAML